MSKTYSRTIRRKTVKRAKSYLSKKLFYIIASILMIISVVLSIYFVSSGEAHIQRSLHPMAYSEIVEREAQNYGIDPLLVYSVMKAESNFESDAISGAGAMGLMQIMPETYEWLAMRAGATKVAKEDLLNPEINIKYGCLFLSHLMKKYPQLKSVLAAYNAGPGNVDSWLNDSTITPDGENLEYIPFPETKKYTEKVLNHYKIYQRIYEITNS